MTSAAGTSHPIPKDYTTAKAEWNKQNAGVLGLIQATTLPVLWQDFLSYSKAQTIWMELEKRFRKAGGGNNLPPIGQHGEHLIH